MPREPKKGPGAALPAIDAEGNKQLAALDALMREVKSLYPEALDELSAVTPKTLRRSVDAWAEKWNLFPSGPIHPFVLGATKLWQENPDARKTRSWTTGIYAFSARFALVLFGSEPNVAEQQARPSMAIEAFPQIESRGSFMARAQAHWAARMNALLSWELPRTRTEPQRRYRWLAQYQLGEMSFKRIAARDRVDEQTVSTGVRAAAKAVGLKLRPPSQGGRPKKSRKPPRY